MRRSLRPLLLLGIFVAGWFVFLVVLALCGQSSGLPARYLGRVRRLPVLQALRRLKHPHTAAVAAPEAVAAPPKAPELPPVVAGSLRFVVPPAFYAAAGVEMSVYFDNLVLTRWPDRLQFEVTCSLGRLERRRWTVVPSAGDVGRHPWQVTVRDMAGKELGRARTTLCVLPEDAGCGKDLRMLFVGDCWVHYAQPLNALAQLLDGPKQPNWVMLGTHVVPQALPRVRHEGYGGWTWNYFLAFDRPGAARDNGLFRDRSPFLFAGKDGKVSLDVSRYFREACDGKPPQVTVFVLGGNDVYACEPDKPQELDACISQVLQDADALLAEFRKAAPAMTIAITVPAQLSAFERIYTECNGPAYTRWRVRQNYHRYQECVLKHFGGRENDGIYLIPTHLNLDAIDAFSVLGDPGTLNELGGRQVAASLYAWLKYWYTRQDQPAGRVAIRSRTGTSS